MFITSVSISSFQINKRVDGKIFTGSITMLETDRRLRTKIGQKIWFTQCRPIAFPEKDIIELFLLKISKLNICCHITGSFATYTAGMFNSYRALMLYLALTDEPFANLLMQRWSLLSDVFTWMSFVFN